MGLQGFGLIAYLYLVSTHHAQYDYRKRYPINLMANPIDTTPIEKGVPRSKTAEPIPKSVRLSTAEAKKVLRQFNQTATDFPRDKARYDCNAYLYGPKNLYRRGHYTPTPMNFEQFSTHSESILPQ